MAEAVCPLCGAVGGSKFEVAGKKISERRGRSSTTMHTCTGCGLNFNPFYSFGSPVQALVHRVRELERKLTDLEDD